jgi:hypothetical protein
MDSQSTVSDRVSDRVIGLWVVKDFFILEKRGEKGQGLSIHTETWMRRMRKEHEARDGRREETKEVLAIGGERFKKKRQK